MGSKFTEAHLAGRIVGGQRGAGADPPAKPKRSRRTSSTAALTKAIIQLLQLEGCTAWRQNNAAVYDPTRQAFRANSSKKGIADVLGYHRATGRFVAVEVKSAGDVLSPEQTDFLMEVRAAGGFACEGRCVEQVRRELQDWKQSI